MNQKGICVSKRVLTEEEPSKPEEILPVKGARFIKILDKQEVDTKKSLQIVQKRLTLHTIQWKVGQKRFTYLIRSGVLQGNFLTNFR